MFPTYYLNFKLTLIKLKYKWRALPKDKWTGIQFLIGNVDILDSNIKFIKNKNREYKTEVLVVKKWPKLERLESEKKNYKHFFLHNITQHHS